MKYWQVTKDTATGLVFGELYTDRELVSRKVEFSTFLKKCGILIPVELSSRKTFWNFGCRFPTTDGLPSDDILIHKIANDITNVINERNKA